MNLPLKWIKRYCEINPDPKEFADRMTMTGSKVEGFRFEGEEIKGVVTGKILSVAPHPDADRLSVCQVSIGEKILQIVTGATNIKAGDCVPVCTDGAQLPGGKTIHSGTLRGVESCGMLCSLGELGLTAHDYPECIEDGIMILPADTAPGQDIVSFLGMDDYIYEFEITPNRPDCLGAEGLSREAAVSYGAPFCFPEPKVEKTDGEIGDLLKVRIDTPENCYRYTGAMVKNVRVRPSPEWMRRLLRQSGVRPINNIVDITNFVMLEYNQPMHAFDHRFVKDGSIIVRQAKEGEIITTLDGVDRTLDPSMMVIADSEKPIAVAGVMGGEYSGIVDDTNTIVFESACFNGVNVRTTSRKLGLRTDASGRYEKGLDPYNTERALLRALELVIELDAGDVIGGIIDQKGNMPQLPTIPLQPERVCGFLGAEIETDFMVNTLKALGFAVSDTLEVTPPSFRADVEGFADLAEEIARFYGYDCIPNTVMSGSAEACPTERQRFDRMLREACLAAGYSEINSYSFMSAKQLNAMLVPEDSKLRRAVVISNPLGEDTGMMRTTAIPAMLETLARNWSARTTDCALFEMASEYIPCDDPNLLPEEPKKLIAGLYGEGKDFYTAKGLMEALAADLRMQICFTRRSDLAWFHPGRTASVLADGEEIAVIGEIHPSVCANYGIKERVVLIDCNADLLYAHRGPAPRYKQLPRYPAMSRDLALVCDADTESALLETVIRESCGALLESIRVFDVYTGTGIAEGSKSIAYTMVFRDPARTLTDAEVDKALACALEALKRVGAVLRS